MAYGFVAARGAAVFISDDMAVDGAKSALGPLSFDGSLELFGAAVEGFILVGGEVGVSASTSTAVVPSSSRGKGGFKLREDF